MIYAPIALFVYKRPEHTKKTLEALMLCPEFAQSPLFIFSDGAKNEKDLSAVEKTRETVRSIIGDKAEIIEANENKGLANSIIEGVTRLVNEFDRVIVLEDDLVVNPKFLEYMNNALELYQDNDQVMQVSGYMFPIPDFANKNEAMFLPFTTSWGWATWKRAWNKFDENATQWETLKTDYKLRYRFNLDNTYNHFEMLNNQMIGKIDSWAIRWYWSVFQHNGYILYPPRSYITNIGFDVNGTHGSRYTKLILGKINVEKFLESITLPKTIEVNQKEFSDVKKYLRNLQPLWLKFFKKILIYNNKR